MYARLARVGISCRDRLALIHVQQDSGLTLSLDYASHVTVCAILALALLVVNALHAQILPLFSKMGFAKQLATMDSTLMLTRLANHVILRALYVHLQKIPNAALVIQGSILNGQDFHASRLARKGLTLMLSLTVAYFVIIHAQHALEVVLISVHNVHLTF